MRSFLFTFLYRLTLITFSLVTSTLVTSTLATAQESVGLKSLEQVFTMSSVVTDSDALTFGIANFELKYLINPDNPKWGDDKTLEFKKSIDLFVLPYNWKLADLDENRSHHVSMRFSYIEVLRNSEPLQGYTNFKNEQIFGGFIEYSQRYQLTKSWYVGASIGGHLVYYRNKYNYSDGFPDEIKSALDGYVFNTTATMLMAEPVFNLGYLQQQSWGQWTAHNSNHYLTGRGIGGDARDIEDVHPEGWRITNGIEFKVDVPQLWGVSDYIAFDFKRVDIGGDMSNISDNGHYYEASVGWVIDTKNKIPLLDNIGIGLNINYGSTISGGTLVFYYNE